MSDISKYLHKQMDHRAAKQHSTHKTKIVATVGPACNTYDQLLALVKAGVNVFRLNFSHGTYEDKLEVIRHVRRINESEPYNIALLADLQGPKLRIGDIENNHLEVNPGDILTFTNEKCIGTREKIYVSYPDFHKDVKVGHKILIDDGKIETRVVEITADNLVKAKVIIGGCFHLKKASTCPIPKALCHASPRKICRTWILLLNNN